MHLRSGRRLVNVVTPAGYGKTTFIAEWASSLDRTPAWITLFDDVGPEALLHHIVQALLPVLPALQPILNLDGGDAGSFTRRVRMLCAEIAAARHPVVLILDDYHLLKTPESHALVQNILDSAPGDLLIVLCSRTMPPLRIDRLVLDDTVLTLTERDFAFDHEDFTALLPLLGLDALPPAVRDDLERRCAGWVTGLKLLAYDLRIAGSSTIPLTLPAPSSDGVLRQFIEFRVLAALPAHLLEFAHAAAPLPWMSAELMAAVTGAAAADCARTLRELIAANAFLSEHVGPDGEAHFRFHPLIHDALRHAAARRPQQPDERRRAAVWFCDHDMVDEAMAILDDGRRTAEDDGRRTTDDYSDSLLQHALVPAIRRALVRSEISAAQRWLDALPPELLAAHAPLAVAASWTAVLSESFPRIEQAVARARAALAGHVGADVDELRFEVALHAVCLHSLHGRVDEMSRALAVAESLAHPTDSLGYGYLHLWRAMLHGDPNDIEARVHMLQIAAGIFERIGHHHGVVAMVYTRNLLRARHAHLHDALAGAISLQGFCRLHRLEHLPHARENLLLSGALLYLVDRIPEARETWGRVVRAGDADENLRYAAELHLQLCGAAESDDPAAALDGIDEVADATHWARARRSGFQHLHELVAWPRILRDYRAGHPERCRQTVETLQLTPADLAGQPLDAAHVTVFAGAVLGERLDACVEPLMDAHACSMATMAMHLRMFGVLHRLQRGEHRDALDQLRALLPLVERSGAVRIVLDFPIVRALLTQCDTPFARHLLTRFTPPPVNFELTPQETRILKHLKESRTTKEIAALHFVAPKTIYVQIHRIFKKLGVHNREDALAAWRG